MTDDAIFMDNRGHMSRALLYAMRRAIAASRHVIAGNGFLAEMAAAPDNTSVIPTVIDADGLLGLRILRGGWWRRGRILGKGRRRGQRDGAQNACEGRADMFHGFSWLPGLPVYHGLAAARDARNRPVLRV